MSGVVWSKFYWSDWESDPGLKVCSLAAQGLWMRMLCVAAQHDPIGFVCLSDRPLSVTDLARLAGVSETEADALVAELAANGVFSRDRIGRPYSRRMVREGRALAEARAHGKRGGSPLLARPANPSNPSGNSRGVKGGLKASLKAGVPHQSPEASTRVGGPKSPPNPGGGVAAGERAASSPPSPLDPIPADLRAEVVGLMGEDYVRAWLDPARWDGERIVCRLGIAAERLRRDLRTWLGRRGVEVALARPAEPNSNAAPSPPSHEPSMSAEAR